MAKHDEEDGELGSEEKRGEERLDAPIKAVLKNSTISSVIQWIAATYYRRHHSLCHQTAIPTMPNYSKYQAGNV
ncbi:hypothetical protein [Endozoicomonas sp. ALB091]|uniref:hypothetical protein n=1 Tax=Endozoicomonas sp. ALB091 TaxID=3403073 RepID=UPI003BB547D9